MPLMLLLLPLLLVLLLPLLLLSPLLPLLRLSHDLSHSLRPSAAILNTAFHLESIRAASLPKLLPFRNCTKLAAPNHPVFHPTLCFAIFCAFSCGGISEAPIPFIEGTISLGYSLDESGHAKEEGIGGELRSSRVIQSRGLVNLIFLNILTEALPR